MLTIQGLLHFIKTECAGRTLNTPLIHTKTFSNKLFSDNKFRLPEILIYWAIEMMRRMKKKGYSHVLFLNTHAF